jgi:membrane protease YdiL (CAAX protease family)
VNSLQELIRRLPPGVEFLVVVSWAFGLPIFSSILSLGAEPASRPGSGGAPAFDNAALIGILVFELAQSLFLVWFLRLRGWTLEKIGLSVSWRGAGWGWMLMVSTYVLAMGSQAVAQWVMPAAMQAAEGVYPRADPQLSMQLVFLVSTVNGIFEEVFVAGYIISALAPRGGIWVAINVSTMVRLLYHLYQGPLGILAVVPMGLLYGYFYARTRQLWPLILAHILIDIIGLTQARW